VAEGLAEMHAKFENTSITKEQARAARKSDADYFLSKFERPAVIKALGGVENAHAIQAAVRAQLYEPFLAADLPSSAYHGDANVGNFKVDGWLSKDETFTTVSTFDVGTMTNGFPEGEKATLGGGIKPAAAGDAGRFLGSLALTAAEAGATPAELLELQTSFMEKYLESWDRETRGHLDVSAMDSATRWYGIEFLVTATFNDPMAIGRIADALHLELPNRNVHGDKQ
jgi:hypothetical protein